MHDYRDIPTSRKLEEKKKRSKSENIKKSFGGKSKVKKPERSKGRVSPKSKSTVKYEQVNNDFTLSKIIRRMKKRDSVDHSRSKQRHIRFRRPHNSYKSPKSIKDKSLLENSKEKRYSSNRLSPSLDKSKVIFRPSKRDKETNSFTLSFKDLTTEHTTKLPEIKLNRLGFEDQEEKLKRIKRKRRVKRFYSKLSNLILKDVSKENKDRIFNSIMKGQDPNEKERLERENKKKKSKRKVNSVDVFWLRKENQRLKDLGYEINNLDLYVKKDASEQKSSQLGYLNMSRTRGRKVGGYGGSFRSFSYMK